MPSARRTLTTSLLAAAALAGTGDAFGQSADARGRAMGGTGVASSLAWDAPFVNPALTRFRSEAIGSSSSLPFLWVGVADEGELLDAVDDLQDTIDELQARLDANDPSADSLRPLLARDLSRLDRRRVFGEADVGVSVLLPFVDWTLAASVRSTAEASAFPIVDPADLVTIADPNSTSADLDDLQSDAVVLATHITEFGLTAAWEGQLDRRRFSFGVTPKVQYIESYHYAQSVSGFEDGDAFDELRSSQSRRQRTDVNFDVGAAYEFEEGATLGLAVRNALRNSYSTVDSMGRTFRAQIEPRPTLGFAVERAGMQFAADVDLIQTSPFDELPDSQFVRLGFEYDAFGWAQLRTGLAHDLQGERQDQFTVGLGVSALPGLMVDAAVLLSDDSLGGGLRLGVRW